MFLNRSYAHLDVLTKASITIQIIEDVAIYKAQIFSSNGNVFGTNDKTSEIHLVVWKGLTDITDKFTDIVWRRFTSKTSGYEEDLSWGEQYNGLTSFTLTRDDIDERAKIQAEVYASINGERKLVAVDYINFIDVNDLQGSPFPPSNPNHGDLWLDTSVTPPRLMMWDSNLQMWIEVTVAGKDRRNLIRNSNFYKASFDYWEAVNNPILEIESLNAKKWVRIKSDKRQSSLCGIKQVVNNINVKSKYTFQMLSEVYIQSASPEGNALVTFYSINDENKKTLLKEEVFDITADAYIYTSTFTTLEDTKKIEVNIGGEKKETFDFLVTNIKLENHPVATEWELAIEDMQDALDNKLGNTHEEVFNSLTDDGKMQGLYVDIDNQGRKNFYFNASYIKTGKLLGEYIEGRNLTVKDNSGNKTLEITDNGELNIRAKSISIGINPVATTGDVNTAVGNLQIGGRNLLVIKTKQHNVYINETTGLNTQSGMGHSASDYIIIHDKKQVTLSYDKETSGDYRIVFYDNSKRFISGNVKSNNGKLTWTVEVPRQAFFARVSCPDYNNTKLEVGNKATSWTPAPEDVDHAISSNTTAITVAQGKIEGLVSENTVIKGDINTVNNKYTSLKATVDGIDTTVASHTSSIGVINNSVGNLNEKVATVEDKHSSLSQNLEGFKTTVGSTYSTKSELSGVDGKVSSLTNKVNKTESSITQLKDEIKLKVESTDITEAVDNIQIGGRNLIPNSAPKTNDWNWAGTSGTKELINELTAPFGNAMKVTSSATSTSSQGGVYKAPKTKLIVGKSYSWSVWLKASNAMAIRVGMEQGGLKLCSVTTSWQKFTYTFTATDTSNYAFIMYTQNPVKSEYFLAHSIMVEEGNKSTGWSPAPEDTDSSISNVQSQVVSTNNKVALIETNLSGITQRVQSTENTVSSHTTQLGQVDNKIDAAQTDAKNYTDGQITTVNQTIVDKMAEIKLTTDSITQKVSSNESNITHMTNTSNKLTTGLNKWLVEIFDRGSITGTNAITINDLMGKTPVKTLLLEDKTGYANLGDNYLGRYTTNVYLEADYSWTVNAKSDDGGTIYLNGTVIATTGTTAKSVTLNFKKGWNKITWVYNEHTGEDGCCFSTKLSSLSQIKIMTAYDQTNINEGLNVINSSVATTSNKVALIETNLSGITQRVQSTESTVSSHTTQLGTVDNRIDNAKNDAIDSSKGYTDGEITTVNKTIVDRMAEIKLTTDSITQKVSATENKVTTVTNNLNSLQVGGRNLQQNTSFKTNLANWTVGTGYARETVKKFENTNTVKFTRTGLTSDTVAYLYSGTKAIPMTVGEVVTASANFYTDSVSSIDGGKAFIGIWFYNAAGETISNTKTAIPFVNGKWIKCSHTATAPTNTVFTAIVIGTNRNGTYYIGKPKFERGNKATDWSPAPEDIDSSLDNVQSQISSTSNKVALIETNLSGITQRVQSTESTMSTHTTQLSTVDSRIDSAKNSAINAAANDATNKANNAIDSAKGYTDKQITTVNKTVTDKLAEINVTTDAIAQRVGSTENNVSTITSNFNNLKIGGRNLIKKKSQFTYGYIDRTTGAINNSGSLNANQDFYTNEYFELKQGETIYFSSYTKGINSTIVAGVYIHVYNTNKVWQKSVLHSSYANQNAQVSYKATENCYVRFTSRGYTVYNHKAEYGTKPTDWTPAPEDINSDIASVDSKVESTNSKLAELKLTTDSITQKVSATESKVNSITTNFNNLQIGGRNLLTKDIFESGNLSGQDGSLLSGASNFYRTKTFINVDSNEKYTLKINKCNSGDEIEKIIAYSENGQFISTQYIKATETVFTCPANCKKIKFICIVNNAQSTNIVEEFKIKLEKGNKATDWTPAPEDITNDIASVNSKIESTTNKLAELKVTTDAITQKVSATETNVTTITTNLNNKEDKNNRVIYAKGSGNDFPANRVLKIGNKVIYDTTGRGARVTALIPSTLAVHSDSHYDLHAGGDNETNFINKINELNNGDYIIVVTSYDNAFLHYAKRCEALYKIGGFAPRTSLVGYREAYALIGRSKLGKGNGIEMYIPKTETDRRCAEVSVKVTDNGAFMGVNSSNMGAQMDAVDTKIETTKSKVSEIATNLDSIKLSVQSTESTVSNHTTQLAQVDNKINTAQNNAINSSKGYTDGQITTVNKSVADKVAAINLTTDSITQRVASTENKLTSTTTIANSANNKIDNLAIGGRNLLSMKNVINRSSDNFTKNQFGVTFTHNSEWQGVQFYNLIDIMELNKSYILQYKIRKTAGSLMGISHHIDSQFTVVKFTIDGALKDAVASVQNMGINDSNWHTCVLEVKRVTNVAGNGSGDTNRIIPQPNRGLATSVSVEMKDFQIEQGNAMTGWTPAPEDINSLIDTKANSADVYNKTETYSKTQADAAIKVAKDEINLGVSNTYETKTNVTSKVTTAKTEAINAASADASSKVNAAKGELNTAINKKANSVDVYTKSEVYTKNQTDSAIKVAKDNIELGVSNTYETKTNVVSKVNTAKTEAISSASTDATNKVNAAKNELNTAINKKANSTDVYTKSETYTRDQTDSAIKVAKDAIELGVKNTYETKSDVESKITTAVNNVQVGGRNSILNSTGNLGNTNHWAGVVLDTGKKVEGCNSFKLTRTNYASGNPRHQGSQTIDLNRLSLKTGDYITLSGWIYVDSSVALNSGQNEIAFRNYYNSSNSYEDLCIFNYNNVAKNTWTKFSMTSKATKDSAKAGTLLISIFGNGLIWVSKLKLEKGTKATDFTLAPEDVDSVINSKANSTDVYKKSEVYTKTQTDSAIKVAKDNIELGVSNTYETKSNVTSAITTAKTEAVNTSKSYADTKKSEAISSAATDATNKVNAAKNELNTEINKKANSADVYNKTEVYTKTQTDSAIKVAKDNIELGVKNTYETKTNVENKITNATTTLTNKIDNLQIGSKNLAKKGCFSKYNTATDTTVTDTNFVKNGSVTFSRKAVINEGPMIDRFVVYEVGKEYVISFKLKKTAGTVNSIHVYNGCGHTNSSVYIDGVYKGTLAQDLAFPTDTNYHNIEIYFKAGSANRGDGTAINTVHTILQPMKGTAGTYTMEVLNFKIEAGNKPTGWTPAPEDIQSYIDSKANATDVYNKSETYTQAQVNSAIKVAKESIELGVSNTYETKTNVVSSITSAKTEAINTSKNYADTKKSEAISSAATDATNKVNSAKSELNTAINKKANSTDVYNKTETYTQAQVNSAIKVAKESIELGVSNTYETKTNVTSKITTAKTEAVNTSKSYADTKKSEAITQAGKDADSKVLTAVNNLETGGVNLLIVKNITRNKYLNNTGAVVDNAAWFYSDYINIKGFKNVRISGFTNLGSAPSTCFYDANKSFISGIYNNNSGNAAGVTNKCELMTVPSNAVYMRCSGEIANLSTLKIEQGTKATAYSPAPQDVANSINTKANSADVYTKTEVYTKTQTDSAIKVAKDAIELGVRNSYETKTNVESKITNAINNVQVGGKNLLLGTKNWKQGLGSGSITSEIYDGCKVLYKDYSSESSSKYVDIAKWDNAIAVKPNTEYTLSFYAKGTGRFTSYFYPSNVASGYSSEGVKTTATDGSVTHTLTSGWKKYWITWKTLSSATGNKSIIAMRLFGGAAGSICMVKLEEGNKASSYTEAPEDIDSIINSKANSTDVYSKSEVYTKAQADSAIKIAKDAIDLSVSQTYETKSNVENKITTAVNNISIGGRNLLVKNALESGNISGANGAVITGTYENFYRTKNFIDINNSSKYVLKIGKGVASDIIEKIVAYNSSGTYISTQYVNAKQTVFTPPANCTKIKFIVVVANANVSTIIESFNIKLESGTKATDWTAAPEDINSAISLKANSADVYNKSEVYTKTQADSAIKVAKDAIDLSVSNTYETKTNVTSKISTAKTEAVNSAVATSKSYADTKKAEAISSAATDAASKVNAAKNELNTAINKKANSTDVYTKSETYTKAQTDSAIKVAKDNIELGVKNTYETKSNVETKITNAVNNVQIGGRNLAQLTSNAYSNAYSSFDGNTNKCPTLATVLTDGLKVGDVVTVRLIYKYTNIVPASGQTAKFWIQGSGNTTSWNAGGFNSSGSKTISGSGELDIVYSFTINADHLKNTHWNTSVRHDYVQSGSVQWKSFKVEKGTKATDWTPAPEDVNVALNKKANSVDVYTKSEVYTKAQADSAIKIAKDAIDLSVSQNYETKTNVESKINSAVNNVQVGVRNLVKNSATLNNSFSQLDTFKGTRTILNDSTAKSGKVIKVECTTAGRGFYCGLWNGDDSCIGKKYTWSFYAKMNASKTLGTIGHERGGLTSIAVTTEWKKFTHTWTYASSGNRAFIFYPNFVVGDVLYIKDLKIEEGTKSTDWSPAPEDVDSSISSVQSQVATTNNKVASIETNLNGITQRVSSTESTVSTHTTQLGTVDNRINTAKNAAISTAATDATTKANNAQNKALSDSKNYTNGQITTVTQTLNSRVAEIKATTDSITQKVSANETKVNTVTANLNNLKIGGENVLRNSNFANGLSHWSTHDMNSGGSNKSITVINGGGDWSPAGKKILQIRGTSTTNRYGVIGSTIKLIPKTQYTISGYCAGHRVGNLQVNIRDINNGSGNLFTKDITPVSGGSTLDKWHRFELTFTTNANTDFALNLYSVNFADNGYVWFCDVQIQQGTKASAWTPCSLDIDASIANVDSKVTSTNNKVATIETNLNGITQRVSSTESTVSSHTTQLGTVDNRINTAKNAAISTAASDATTKANNAQSKALADSKTYTNGQITTVNQTINSRVAEIKATTDGISQKVSATESKVNSVTTSFNNLQIGGRNLFLKSDIDKHSKGNWTNNGSGVISVEGTYIDGTKTIKVVGGEGISYNSYIKLKRNTTYTYSMMMKSSGAMSMSNSTPLHMWLKTATNSDNSHLEAIVNKCGSIPANTWTKAWISFKTPNSQDTYYMKPFVYGIGSNTVYITKVKVEEGEKATDWSPAPEDVDSAITSVDNKVTSTNNKVASIETNLSSITSRVSTTENNVKTINGNVSSLQSRVSSAEQKITSNAIISTVQSTINNAKNEAINSANSSTDNKLKNYATTSSLTQTTNNITASFKSSGGYNLISNSTGYNDTSLWTASGATLGTAINNNIGGATNTYMYLDNGTKTSESFAFSRRFKIKANTKYTLSGWFHNYTKCPNFDVFLLSSTSVAQSDTGTSYTNAQILISAQNTSASWKKYSVTFTTPANVISGYIRIDNNGYNSSGTNSNRIHWSALMLNEGEEQPWSPHPDENYAGIVKLDANGVQVSHTGANTKTQMDSKGFFILNSQGETVGSLATETGLSVVNANKVYADNIRNIYEGDSNLYVNHDYTGDSDGSSSKPFKSFSDLRAYLSTTPIIDKDVVVNIVTKSEIGESLVLSNLEGNGSLKFQYGKTAIHRTNNDQQWCINMSHINLALEIHGGRTSYNTSDGALLCDSGNQHGIKLQHCPKFRISSLAINCINWGIYLNHSRGTTANIDFCKTHCAFDLNNNSHVYDSDACGNCGQYFRLYSGSTFIYGSNGGGYKPHGSKVEYSGKYFLVGGERTDTNSFRTPPPKPSTSDQYGTWSMTDYGYFSYGRNGMNVNKWNPGSKKIQQGEWSGLGNNYGFAFFNDSSIRSWLANGTPKDGSTVTIKRASEGGYSSSQPIYLHGATNTNCSGVPSGLKSYGNIGSLAWGETKTFNLPTAAVNDLKSGAIKSLCFYDSSGSSYVKLTAVSIKLKANRPV